MSPLSRRVIISLALGILSALGILVSILALLDISQGEADVSLEWRVVRAGLVVTVLFHAFAVPTLAKVLGVLKRGNQK